MSYLILPFGSASPVALLLLSFPPPLLYESLFYLVDIMLLQLQIPGTIYSPLSSTYGLLGI